MCECKTIYYKEKEKGMKVMCVIRWESIGVYECKSGQE